MKKHIKHLLLSSIATVAFLGNIQSSVADVATDTEKLLNWAQNNYKNFFPSIQPTQTLEPWLYRFYPETGIYAGVNKSTNDVYVMGGQFGNDPQHIQESLAATRPKCLLDSQQHRVAMSLPSPQMVNALLCLLIIAIMFAVLHHKQQSQEFQY